MITPCGVMFWQHSWHKETHAQITGPANAKTSHVGSTLKCTHCLLTCLAVFGFNCLVYLPVLTSKITIHVRYLIM